MGDDTFPSIMVIITIVSSMMLASCIEQNSETPKATGWIDLYKTKEIIKSFEDVNFKIIDDLDEIDTNANPERTLIIIIGLEKDIGSDALRIYNHIMAGGKVLIASESARINAISRSFGIICYGHRIYSENFDKNLSFIRAEGIIEDKRYSILYNAPSGFYIESPCVGNITNLSYFIVNGDEIVAVDYNDNGQIEGDEWPKSTPVPCVIKTIMDNGGTAVFVSNAGIFVDDMIDRYDNRAFIKHLFSTLIPQGYVKVYFHVGYQKNRNSGYLLYGD